MAIENNQVVSIEYTLTELGNDEIIDSNVGMHPLTFMMGRGMLIPGLENQLKNFEVGQSARVTVEPSEAYGEYNQQAVDVLPVEQFSGIELQIGMPLYGKDEDGSVIEVLVKDFNENEVVIDFNHPLAGKTLCFNVSVLDVRDATAEEVITGRIATSGGCCGGHQEDECCGTHSSHDEDGCCGGHGHNKANKHHNGGGCGCH
ncbi:MAG: peptidylprolyl isomerase [Campylobacterales bacterium]|nr:peptidylprolyl isomerase [Campylobacterales bacterium]